MRVLHLTSTLGPSAIGKHLSLVAPELAHEFAMSVVNLGEESPFTAAIRAAGLTVERLPWRGLLDFASHRELRRRVVEGRYEGVHIWGDRATVAANAFHLPGLPIIDVPLVVADSHDDASWMGKLERRIRARAVTVCDLPPAIDVGPIAATPRREFGLADDAEVIVAVGQFDNIADLRSVVWAFDILIYNHPRAMLVIVGNGPQRSRLERMARDLQRQRYGTVFVDARPGVRNLLAMADVVVVPHRVGGVNVALEAMAAGRAVIVRDTPELTHAVCDGGVTIPNGDPKLFAKAMGNLLNDAAERTRLGHRATQRAAQIGTRSAVEYWRDVYRRLAFR